MIASRRHSGTALSSVFTWAIVACTSARGVEFAGGTGEPNNPYQIATAEQMLTINSARELTKKHYVLVASIDLRATVGSMPVIVTFGGNFDGRGNTIRNLRIEGGRALFNYIESDGVVKNLGVVNAYVVDTSHPGALAGDNFGRVINCYSTGKVIGRAHAAGGLVGSNWGIVDNCYSTATVEGQIFVGGLVGENVGTISFCHSTGDISAYNQVGGLVGTNGGTITSSYCVATVSAVFMWVGGLAGQNWGTITSCYANATVTSEYGFAGALVGENDGLVSSCYSIGSVTANEDAGGLAGESSGRIVTSYSAATVICFGRRAGAFAGSAQAATGVPKPVRDCYFLAPDYTWLDNGIGTSLTDRQMKQQASFENWDFWGNADDGIRDLWFMPENAYPVLAWQTEITGLHVVPNVSGLPLDEARVVLIAAGFVPGNVSYDFHKTIPAGCVIHAVPYTTAPAGTTVDLILSSGGTYDWAENPGNGTADNPYQIRTPGQLESLTDHLELWDKYFVLTADLDMVGRTYSAALIAPDTDISQSGFQGTPFRGRFDGRGRTIRNLTISTDWQHDYVGLFGMIASAGRIANLNLAEAQVKGGSGSNSYVGVLAGYNAGTIVHCSASGAVHGGKGDGFVGVNSGILTDCEAEIARI
jgi:hypothetical protein